MKKLLPSTIVLALCSLLLLVGCSPEENDPACDCEEVFYAESKSQNSSDEWVLNRTETSRESVDCQDETDYIRTGNGTEVSRIECN